MNLTIDFETLTLNEAESLEEATGLGLDAIGQALQDPMAPKMKLMKALAAIAYARENGGTVSEALVEVGTTSLVEFTEGMKVESGDNPLDETGQ